MLVDHPFKIEEPVNPYRQRVVFRHTAETPGIHTIMGLVIFWQIRFNGENELFKMQKVIELKHQVSATFQFLSELWSNNSGEMS